MANIAATDITFTLLSKEIGDKQGRIFNWQLAFGNGVLTYGAGGVPITTALLGCPAVVDQLVIYDFGNGGYLWEYDRTNLKLVAHQMPAHNHPLNLKNAAVADGATTRVNAGTNLLGANTGGDLVVAGGGANGGVQNVTAAVLSEPSTVAIAAQTLRIRVVGW